jgi:hypothetical protein
MIIGCGKFIHPETSAPYKTCRLQILKKNENYDEKKSRP